MIRPKASRSWRQPFENCTWLIAIVAVRGASPSAKDSRRSTPSTAATKRTSTPRWIQGSVTVGNSSSSESTGPSPSSRSAIRLMPVEVFGTKAISSGCAPTKRATLPPHRLAPLEPGVPVAVAALLELAVEGGHRLAHGARA